MRGIALAKDEGIRRSIIVSWYQQQLNDSTPLSWILDPQALGKYRFAACDLKLIVSRNNALNQLSKCITFNAATLIKEGTGVMSLTGSCGGSSWESGPKGVVPLHVILFVTNIIDYELKEWEMMIFAHLPLALCVFPSSKNLSLSFSRLVVSRRKGRSRQWLNDKDGVRQYFAISMRVHAVPDMRS